MRLTPFLGMDELGQPIDPRRAERRAEIARQMRCVAKASESALPADERRGAYVPGDDPVELRPVRRLSFSERSHVAIGIKGGQGRSGAELELNAGELALCLAIPAGIALGCCGGHLIARLADAAGRLLSPLFF